MRIASGSACAASLFLLVGRAAAAQGRANPHAVQPERPTVATHAGTVAPGWLEIETGVQIDRVAPNARSVMSPTVFKFGVGAPVQFSLFVPLLRPAGGTTGVGDVGAGVKWRLTDGGPLVGRFAIQPSIKLATGDEAKGLGSGTTDYSLLAISSHVVGPVAIDLTSRSASSSDGTNSAAVTPWSRINPAR